MMRCKCEVCVGGRGSLIRIFIFFFQAEDGIRDYKVTGVQTCALPISSDLAQRNEGTRSVDCLPFAWTKEQSRCDRCCSNNRSRSAAADEILTGWFGISFAAQQGALFWRWKGSRNCPRFDSMAQRGISGFRGFAY